MSTTAIAGNKPGDNGNFPLTVDPPLLRIGLKADQCCFGQTGLPLAS
jgi:hypothetical protein